MLTIESLKAFGANTEEGVARCVNNEAFYIRMVGKAVVDPNFDKLSTSVASGDLDAAFEAAHALKGILGNLSLTPVLEPVKTITELLRSKENADYASLVNEIIEKKNALAAL